MNNLAINKKVAFGVATTVSISVLALVFNARAMNDSTSILSGNTQLLSIGLIILSGVVVTWFLNRSISSSLSGVTNKLNNLSSHLSGESKSVNDSSSLLSKASTGQASSIQQTVAAIDEISTTLQRNADSAHSAAQVSVKSTEAASRGKKTVESMIKSIDEISSSNDSIMNEVKESNNEISKIATMISEIGEKTKIINDIVFQTKLLSFNASVEAARAGEHGKGFAVVAEEVGNLAAVSGKAALEITEMLDSSIAQVNTIVENTKAKVDNLIQSGQKKIVLGSKTAEECGQAIEEISSNVKSVNEMIKEISTASSEQKAGVRDVTKAIQELDRSTVQNSTIAKGSSEVARNLEEHSSMLKNSISELAAITGQQLNNSQAHFSGHTSFANKKSSASSNNVVDMASHKRTKKQQPKPSPRKEEVKQAVNSELAVPSSDDPRFVDL